MLHILSDPAWINDAITHSVFDDVNNNNFFQTLWPLVREELNAPYEAAGDAGPYVGVNINDDIPYQKIIAYIQATFGGTVDACRWFAQLNNGPVYVLTYNNSNAGLIGYDFVKDSSGFARRLNRSGIGWWPSYSLLTPTTRFIIGQNNAIATDIIGEILGISVTKDDR